MFASGSSACLRSLIFSHLSPSCYEKSKTYPPPYIFMWVFVFLYCELMAQNPNSLFPLDRENILAHMGMMDTSAAYISRLGIAYMEQNPTDESFSKKLGRWSYFWLPREGGGYHSYSKRLWEYQKSNPQACASNGNWRQLGPVYPNQQQSGIIVSLYSPPHNHDIVYAGSNTGGLWRTTDAGQHWKCITDTLRMPALGVNSIVANPDNPNIMYIATGYSTEFFQGYGIGVLKSLDGGDTWDTTGLSFQIPQVNVYQHHPYVRKLLMHPSNYDILYGISEREIYKTTDAGATWAKVFEMNGDFGWTDNFIDIEAHPFHPDTLYVSTRAQDSPNQGATILFSADGGQNWTYDIGPLLVNGSPFHTQKWDLGITKAKPDTLFAVALLSTGKRVIIQTGDLGQSWQVLNGDIDASSGGGTNWLIGGPMFYRTGFEINDHNPDIMYLAGNVLLKSWNGGKDFSPVTEYHPSYSVHSSHADIRAVLLYPSQNGINDTVFMGNDGGVSRTFIGGDAVAEWDNLNGSELVVSQVFDVANTPYVPHKVLAGVQDNGTSLLHNGTTFSKGGDGGQCLFDWKNPGIAYGKSNWDLMKSWNGGASFGGTTYVHEDVGPFRFQIDPHRNDRIYVANSYLYFTTLNNNLQQLDKFSFKHVFKMDNRVSDFEVAASNPDVAYWAFSTRTIPISPVIIDTLINGIPIKDTLHYTPHFLKSTNRGVTWQDITHENNSAEFLLWEYINTICVDPENADRLWVGLSGMYANPDFSGLNRVMHSADGGITWQTWGKPFSGLPPVPVNDIEYRVGTRDELYAATDVGVYRYNSTDSVWECFNGGLPVCMVTDIELDNCSDLIHIGTFGRGVWEADLPALTAPHIVTQSATWDGLVVMPTDLEIHAPAVLTLKGILSMQADRSIRVQRGAKLIIDGGTLTNNCGKTWAGIDVAGTTSASQYTAGAQGSVVLLNGALIEHARDAITTNDFSVWDGTGGIVIATDATFRNNKRDLEYYKYQNFAPATGQPAPNAGFFRNCKFLLDDDYRYDEFGQDVKQRVTLWAVDGIEFQSCTFANTNSQLAENHKPTALYGLSAGFEVTDCPASVCTPSQQAVQSSVEGFYRGIHAQTEGSTRTFKVDRTRFTQNTYGIVSEGINYFKVIRNEFVLGQGATPGSPSSLNPNMGLVIRTGTGFQVEGNTFSGTPATHPDWKTSATWGTHTENTGADNNWIYRNSFSKLYVANAATGTNRGGTTNDNPGLQYVCNSQTENDYDIATGLGKGIRFYQGTPPILSTIPPQNSISAQNTHSRNGITESDYYVHATYGVEQFYDNANINTQALDYTNGWFVQTVGDENACPVLIKDPIPPAEIEVMKNSFTLYENNLNTARYLFTSLIDGGNTEALIAYIGTEWSSDAWEMRNELLSRSPNLSIGALHEAAYSGVLPDAMLMEVLLANVGACRDRKFLAELAEDIPNPLPENLINLLLTTQAGNSARKELEAAIVHYEEKKTQLVHTLIQNAYQDSVLDKTLLRYGLRQLNTPLSRYQLAESYLEEGSYSLAQATIDSVLLNTVFVSESPEEVGQYIQLFSIKKALKESGRSLGQLSPEEQEIIETIAGSVGYAAVQAQNILCFLNHTCSEIEPFVPNGGENQRYYPQNISLSSILTKVQIYPNPVKDYAIIEFELPEYAKNTRISISDIRGHTLKEWGTSDYKGQVIWDTQGIASGIYLIAISTNEEKLYSNKIILTK